MKQITLPEYARALKVKDNELWSCQRDGIAVYDKELKLLRTMGEHGGYPIVRSVALLSDDTVVVAGAVLYISTKSGRWIYYK